MITTEFEGEVKQIKSNKTAMLVDETWFNIFGKLDDVEVGDTVKGIYKEKVKGNMTFRNIQSYEVVKKTEKPKELPKTDKNTLRMARMNAFTNCTNQLVTFSDKKDYTPEQARKKAIEMADKTVEEFINK